MNEAALIFRLLLFQHNFFPVLASHINNPLSLISPMETMYFPFGEKRTIDISDLWALKNLTGLYP